MKILHIGKYYHPFKGGMETVVKDICDGLAEDGHEVEVLCSNTSLFSQTDMVGKVKVTRLGRIANLFGQCINPTLVFQLLKKVKEADLIHVHSPNPLAELICLLIPKEKPVVVTYHSDVVRQKLLVPFYAPILKRFLNRVRKVFVATQNHIDHSQFLPHYKAKCEIIPFGIKDEKFECTHEIIEATAKVRQDHGPYILFVGRLVGYKGIDVLINSAQNFDYKIVIVGQGPEENNLKKLTHKLGLEKQITFLGHVDSKEEFLGLYHGCEFLVLPSVTVNENFGVVQIEAMACSKAVITTNLKSGVPAVGKKNETCLIVEPGSIEQLSKNISLLMENSELKEKFGREGRKRFEKYYTFDKMISSHVSSYEKVFQIEEIIQKHSKNSSTYKKAG